MHNCTNSLPYLWRNVYWMLSWVSGWYSISFPNDIRSELLAEGSKTGGDILLHFLESPISSFLQNLAIIQIISFGKWNDHSAQHSVNFSSWTGKWFCEIVHIISVLVLPSFLKTLLRRSTWHKICCLQIWTGSGLRYACDGRASCFMSWNRVLIPSNLINV
jgi:hypothetical protein